MRGPCAGNESCEGAGAQLESFGLTSRVILSVVEEPLPYEIRCIVARHSAELWLLGIHRTVLQGIGVLRLLRLFGSEQANSLRMPHFS